MTNAGTPPDWIYRAWRRKRFDLITSEWQIAEFRRVSRYPELRRYLKPTQAGNLINGLRHQATVLNSLSKVEAGLINHWTAEQQAAGGAEGGSESDH